MAVTLRLASDNSNVEAIPVRNLMDIAGMARGFADDLTAGEHGEVARVIIIAEADDGLKIFGWGENTSPYELMGLFEAAKLRVFAEDIVE